MTKRKTTRPETESRDTHGSFVIFQGGDAAAQQAGEQEEEEEEFRELVLG